MDMVYTSFLLYLPVIMKVPVGYSTIRFTPSVAGKLGRNCKQWLVKHLDRYIHADYVKPYVHSLYTNTAVLDLTDVIADVRCNLL